MKITYDGPSDFQEFSKADFSKAELDRGKLSFEKGVPKTVDDEVGAMLVATNPEDSPIFFDFNFSEVEDDDEPDEEPDEQDDPINGF